MQPQTLCNMVKKQTHKKAHLVLTKLQAECLKPKEPIFSPRSDKPAIKRTKCILKNEIIENFGLF